jgi:hypothetical protein
MSRFPPFATIFAEGSIGSATTLEMMLMADLLESLRNYGSALNAVARSDDRLELDRSARRIEQRRAPIQARVIFGLATVAGVIGVGVLAAGRPTVPDLAVTFDSQPTGPVATEPSLPGITVATSVVAVDSTDGASQFPPPLLLAEDGRQALIDLPVLEPTWLPEGAVEEPATYGDSRDRFPGWAQIYVRELDGAQLVVTARNPEQPTREGTPTGVVPGGQIVGFGVDQVLLDDVAAAVTIRDGRPGWQVNPLPEGFAPKVEGSLGGPSIVRTWTVGDSRIELVVSTSVWTVGNLVLFPVPIDSAPDYLEIRGYQAAMYEQLGETKLSWTEDSGVTFTLRSGGVEDEELIRVAQSLSPIAKEDWTVVVLGAEDKTIPVEGFVPPSAVDVPRLLPLSMPDGSIPISAAAVPFSEIVTPYEQIWLSRETVNPPSVLVDFVGGEALPNEGEPIEIAGRRAVLDLMDGDGTNGLQVGIQKDDGVLYVFARHLNRDELIEFAAGLVPKASGPGYDATVLIRDLELYHDGRSALPGGWSMCWQDARADICLEVLSGGTKASLFRPFTDGRLERVAIDGLEGFIEDESSVRWFLDDETLVTIRSDQLSVDELVAFAATIEPADEQTWNDTWIAAGGLLPD